MKSLLTNTRLVAIALIATFAVAFTTPALANDDKKAMPVELKYLGSFKNKPLFELNFSQEAEFTVTIRDEFGTVLYKDNVKSGTSSKKFVLNTEELGDVGIQVEVNNRKTDKTTVFEINRSSRVVEDLVVNQVK